MVDRAITRWETGGGPREVLLPSGQAAGRWYFPPPLCADDSKSCRAQPSDTYKSDYLPCITHARDRRIRSTIEPSSRLADREMAQVAPRKELRPWPLLTCSSPQTAGEVNSSRNRLWAKSLQELADELDLTLKVCHFPPGTSKWNKIEHRLFCFITKNWRGRPLTTYEVIVNLIASTTTKTGLIVRAAIDSNDYETGITVSDDELTRLRNRTSQVPRRMELHNQTSPIKLLNLFFRGA